MFSRRELICDMGYEEAIVFDNPNYDDAIIGVSEDGRVVYDYGKMVECLVSQDGMTEEELLSSSTTTQFGPFRMQGSTLPSSCIRYERRTYIERFFRQ